MKSDIQIWLLENLLVVTKNMNITKNTMIDLCFRVKVKLEDNWTEKEHVSFIKDELENFVLHE